MKKNPSLNKFEELKKSKHKKTACRGADKDKRLVRLVRLMLLLDKGIVNLDHAAQDCGVSRRTIQRDLNVLEAAGIPLYKPCETNSNYCLAKDFRLFNYHITPQNAEDFLNSYKALLYFSNGTCDLVTPIQKGVLDFAETENKKKEKQQHEQSARLRAIRVERTDFLSLILQGNISKQSVYDKLQTTFLYDLLLTQDYPFAYNRAKTEEMTRVLAHMYRLERRYDGALAYLRKIQQRNPSDSWSYGEMAFVYYEQHNLPQALAVLEEGIRKSSDKESLGLYQAFLLAENKQYEKSLEVFRQFCPYEDAFWAYASQLHLRAGKLQQALSAIDRALNLIPEHGMYQLYKRQILASIKEQQAKENSK